MAKRYSTRRVSRTNRRTRRGGIGWNTWNGHWSASAGGHKKVARTNRRTRRGGRSPDYDWLMHTKG